MSSRFKMSGANPQIFFFRNSADIFFTLSNLVPDKKRAKKMRLGETLNQIFINRLINRCSEACLRQCPHTQHLQWYSYSHDCNFDIIT